MRNFPETIESKRLGTLRRVSVNGYRRTWYLGFKKVELFSYEPLSTIMFPSRRLRLASKGARLVIWVPQKGIRDIAAFTRDLEAQYDYFVKHFDRIIDDLTPAIDSAVREYWENGGEPVPTTDHLLDTGELILVGLSMAGTENRITIRDRTGIVHHHDLELELTEHFGFDSYSFQG